MGIKKDILWRIWLAYLAVVVFGLAVVAKAVHVQVAQGEHYRAMADSANLRYKTIPAERGNIYTEDGELLAASFPFFDIELDPCTASDELFRASIDSVAACLAEMPGGRSKQAWKERIINARRAGSRYMVLARKVPLPDMQRIKAYPMFREGRYRGGLVVRSVHRRVKPYGVLAFRTIGYSRPDIHVGIEGRYDEALAGQPGQRLVQRIAGNTDLPVNDENEIAPENGRDIVMTLDIGIQDVAENALERALIANDAAHGCAVVMEVKTGKILAIANLTRTTEGRYDERLNYAVGEATEPGSTFKLASLLALLEDGASPEATVDLNKGRWKFHNLNMYDSDYPHDDREVTLRDAFIRSSNVGIARLVDDQFSDRKKEFTRILARMHLDQRLGVEVPGEAAPFVKLDPESSAWSGTTLPWMSTGYELQLTPLQVLNLYNTVANGGRMMRPYLVSEIRRDGRPEQTIKPEVLADRIASPKTIEQARELLAAVVEEGTAKRLRDADYAIAGKTGTAKLANRESSYRDRIYQASFAGYFPAEQPVYSCIVVITDPSKGRYYGASVAGPVFKEIADKIYSSKLDLHESLLAEAETETLPATCSGYRRDLHTVCEQLDLPFESSEEGSWLVARNADSVLVLHTVETPDDRVPDVRGMNLRDALYLLENRGLRVEIEGRGRVRTQSIRAGTPLRQGAVVKIRLS